MRHPAYHLRANKAVDRFAFIEAIRYLSKIGDMREYTYYGLGGPYLEEFRLLYEFFPNMIMVSIERDHETVKRQKFHLPCGNVQLKESDIMSFIAGYDANDRYSIFWLDYDELQYSCFDEFRALLSKIPVKSMIKMTLPIDPRKYKTPEECDKFRRKFESIMPNPSVDPPSEIDKFAFMMQEMLQIASQQSLPGEMPHMFQPVSSFYYSDGTAMFTLTGVVWPRADTSELVGAFMDWDFANLMWDAPREIDVPQLSIKERLLLERWLPCSVSQGKMLHEVLGYRIDKDDLLTEAKLRQYSDYHRYFPYFMKGIP